MTMKADLLRVLKRRWLTSLEAVSAAGCWSLSQRCSELRREGVNVIDKWVTLPSGKRVKAFRVLVARGGL